MGLKIKKGAAQAVVQKQVIDADDEVVKVGTGSISKKHSSGAESEKYEEIPGTVGEIEIDAPAYVSVSIGMTRNLGNYESVKFHVALTLPCKNEAEEVEETYDQVRAWVDSKIEGLNEEVDTNSE